MPIYVNGGEAGKLYMMSDPPLQIGKVFDGNGALIYSSGIYPGATVKYHHIGKGTYGDWYYSAENGTNINSTVSYIEVDVTELNAIKVDGTLTGRHTFVWLCTAEQFADRGSTLNYPYYIIDGNSVGLYVAKTTTLPHTFDVSDRSGTMYLMMGGYTNSNGDVSGNIVSVTEA